MVLFVRTQEILKIVFVFNTGRFFFLLLSSRFCSMQLQVISFFSPFPQSEIKYERKVFYQQRNELECYKHKYTHIYVLDIFIVFIAQLVSMGYPNTMILHMRCLLLSKIPNSVVNLGFWLHYQFLIFTLFDIKKGKKFNKNIDNFYIYIFYFTFF